MSNENVHDYRYGSVKVGEYEKDGEVKGRYARLGVLSSEGAEMPEGAKFTVRLEMIPPALLRGETAYINFNFPPRKSESGEDIIASGEVLDDNGGVPF